MFRVAFLGPTRVGKTTLIDSTLARRYAPARHRTIGILPRAHGVWQLWDTAGARRFATVPQLYTRNAAIIVLAFADARTFVAVQRFWYARAVAEAHAARRRGFASPLLVVAALKSDVYGGDVAARDEVHEAYARSIGASYVTVSAKSTASRRAFFAHLRERLERHEDDGDEDDDNILPRIDADTLIGQQQCSPDGPDRGSPPQPRRPATPAQVLPLRRRSTSNSH